MTDELNVMIKAIRFSRDWTVETIYSQILQGNIEFNPNYQKGNAWDDERKACCLNLSF